MTTDAFVNWAGNVTFTADRLRRPTSVAELQSDVAEAAAAGRRIHAVGSRHSFSSIADTSPDGVLVSTVGLDQIVAVDSNASTVTVQAGIRYGELSTALQAAGFALHNLPSLPHITVAGAIATATHGSGDANGNLATAVRSLELVDPHGELVVIGRRDPRFPGVVAGLGAFGVAATVTLAVEPTFDVAQTLYRDLPFATATAHLAEVMASAYSVSLFTDYQRDVFQQVWWKGRIGRDGAAPTDFFGAPPAAVPLHPIESVSAESCTEQLGVPGAWCDRLAHFRLGFEPSSGDELQSEFFVARSDGPAALDAVHALRDGLAGLLKISEVRTVAADDLWLSGAYGRDTLALHFTWVNDQPAVMAFLPLLEAALAPFDARPHWGKLTTMAPHHIHGLYPRWHDFERLLVELDPAGTFRNPYLSELLA